MNPEDELRRAAASTRRHYASTALPEPPTPRPPWVKAAGALVIALVVIGPAIWLVSGDTPVTSVAAPQSTDAPPVASAPTTLPPTTTVPSTTTLLTGFLPTQPPLDLGGPAADPGWVVAGLELFTPRIGMASAIDGTRLFVWGGATPDSGVVHGDGALIDLATGAVTSVAPAPIPGRLDAAAVWTGTEFVVFGGQDFDRSYRDGASFDPRTGRWRSVPPAPVDSAPLPTAVWIDDVMFVWLPGADVRYGEVPPPTAGQFAAYSPAEDSWSLLATPPSAGHTGRLLAVDGDAVLVRSPQVHPAYAPSVGDGPVAATAYDPREGTWSDPVIAAFEADAAAVATVAGSVVAVLSDGAVIRLADDSWELLDTLDAQCPLGVDAHPAGEVAYAILCGDLFLIDADTAEAVPDPPVELSFGQGVRTGTSAGWHVAVETSAGEPPWGNAVAVYRPTR